MIKRIFMFFGLSCLLLLGCQTSAGTPSEPDTLAPTGYASEEVQRISVFYDGSLYLYNATGFDLPREDGWQFLGKVASVNNLEWPAEDFCGTHLEPGQEIYYDPEEPKKLYVKYDSGFALFEAEEYDAEGQNEAMDPEEPREPGMDLGEAEAADAVRFGRPKEVLDNIPLVSNVEVIKTGEDELQIDFVLENVGLCTFAVRIGEEFVLQDEAFVDSTKIEWTASTADGETIFPYMRVNETGDMFMIDWAYNGYCFAIYGKSPQNTSDRDMAGKIALAIIRNLAEEE